jgi:AcrR family transcriptional regulator
LDLFKERCMPRTALTEIEVDAGRARILAAAHKIVSSEGLDALSMRTLAGAVALTPGALYRYFASKDEVIDAVFGGGTTLDNRLLAISDSHVSDLEAVRQILWAYADFAFEDEVRFRTLFLKQLGSAGREFHARGAHRPGAEACKRRIAAAIAAGVFRKLDPDMAFQVLWGAVHGVVALMLTAQGFPFAERSGLVDAAIDNAIRGMLKPTTDKRSSSGRNGSDRGRAHLATKTTR